jgi:hypothetical protein
MFAGKHFGLNAAAEGAHQRLDECHSERLRRTESGRRVLAGGHVVAGDEAALPVAVDQKRLTQLEAMVLPDRYMYLHGVSPTPESFDQLKEFAIERDKAIHDPQRVPNFIRCRGEKTTHRVGSAVPSIMYWPSSSKQAVMASCSLKETSKDGNGGSS